MQEIQRRHVVVQDKQIADAIRSIESRNGMQPGVLRQKLAADGIGLRTLVDQIRTQIGWLQVVKEQLGAQAEVAPAAVARSASACSKPRLASRSAGLPRFSSRSRRPIEHRGRTALRRHRRSPNCGPARAVHGGCLAVQPEPVGAGRGWTWLGATKSA